MTAPRPLAIAHRAGNDPATLRGAEVMGVDMVEADLHLFHGRVEVRHTKTVGPISLLWDRWYVASPFTPRWDLDDLLAAAGPDTELLLDLKGFSRALSRRVAATVERSFRARALSVCARNWRLLDPFAEAGGVRVIHSVSTPRELRRLLAMPRDPQGVSVSAALLTSQRLRALRERSPLVITWGVGTERRLAELAAAGVDGFSVSDPRLLRAVLALR